MLSRIVGPGDPSPDGSTFLSADNPTINSSGQIAFSGQTGNGFGVFLYSDGTIAKVATPGDHLPGKLVLEFADFPQVNDLGHVVFAGDLSNVADAVFVARPITEGPADQAEVVPETGAPDSATPLSLAAAQARHPGNFHKKLRAAPQH